MVKEAIPPVSAPSPLGASCKGQEGASWDQEAIPPVRCVLGSRGDPARQVRLGIKRRSRPSGASWDQEESNTQSQIFTLEHLLSSISGVETWKPRFRHENLFPLLLLLFGNHRDFGFDLERFIATFDFQVHFRSWWDGRDDAA
jgi:hypothetical protein